MQSLIAPPYPYPWGQEGNKEMEGKDEGIERRKCMGGKVVGREVDEQEFSQVL